MLAFCIYKDIISSMNKLPQHKRELIIRCLVEGMSIRATARVADVSKNTIAKLLNDAGKACAAYHDDHVRGITGKRRIECDEIWSFCYAKEKMVPRAKKAPKEAGDVWTWTAIDADSKLMLSYLVSGERDSTNALEFMDDLRQRLQDRPQITTDGLKAYIEAVEESFGADVDYAQVIKEYAKMGGGCEQERKYSPSVCTKIEKRKVQGEPDMAAAGTSIVERQNLTMRMGIRRFTRLTNAFSKRIDKHAAAAALHVMYYNFCRLHQTLKITPAMAAGLTDRVWEISDIVKLIDESLPKPGPRGPYKKRNAISN